MFLRSFPPQKRTLNKSGITSPKFSLVSATITAGTRGVMLLGTVQAVSFSADPAHGCFPPPSTVEEQSACFVVCDHNGQQLAYVYFEKEAAGGRPPSYLQKTRRGGLRQISRSCRSFCADEIVVSYLVVVSGSGDGAAWVEYKRPLTRASHLSSAARPFAILKARLQKPMHEG
jgi:hypothetical protein